MFVGSSSMLSVVLKEKTSPSKKYTKNQFCFRCEGKIPFRWQPWKPENENKNTKSKFLWNLREKQISMLNKFYTNRYQNISSNQIESSSSSARERSLESVKNIIFLLVWFFLLLLSIESLLHFPRHSCDVYLRQTAEHFVCVNFMPCRTSGKRCCWLDLNFFDYWP